MIIEEIEKKYYVCTNEERNNINEGAIKQFIDAMNQFFSVSGFLAPDFHQGYSLPIGAVIATKGHIVPAWVGYDIGCGMCALKLDGIDIDYVKKYKNEIFDLIYKKIPVGFNTNDEQFCDISIDGLTDKGKEIAISKRFNRAIGSLGGGNHFIEIGHDENDEIWVVIHSGSRGVGHGIASHYMTLASSDIDILGEEFDKNNDKLLKYNPSMYDEYKKRFIINKQGKLRPKEGHYSFKSDSQHGIDYIQDLNWCLDFALSNRKEMMRRVIYSITECIDISCYELDFSELINRNHNHAVLKDGLWIHRKGATHAEKGMMGVIPGNMKDGSFIVKGKGDKDSLYSSSHGAGRVMSRKKASETLNIDDFKESMKGIAAKVDNDTIDESPKSYKNIYEVMELQKDLVEVIAHVRPIINIKG